MDTARRALMADVASLPRSAGRRWTRGEMQGLLLRSDALFAGERDFSGGLFTGLVISGDLPRLRIVGSMVVDVCGILGEDDLTGRWVFFEELFTGFVFTGDRPRLRLPGSVMTGVC